MYRATAASCIAAVLAVALTGCGDRRSAEPAPSPSAAAIAKTQKLDFEEALVLARERRLPLIVEFHAPWCYSCYYMASHVLTGTEWAEVTTRAVVAEVDADAPEGAALKERFGVRALPSYLVLDADGRELGRILGEQTREDFYAALHGFIEDGSSLEALAAAVEDNGEDSLIAARQVLAIYHARYDTESAQRWFDGLPEKARTAIDADSQAALWRARLEFLAATQREDAAACLVKGEAVLSGELGCARAYEMSRFVSCASGLPEAIQLFGSQRERMQALVESGVFGEARCADERSVVLAAADLDAAIDRRDDEIALLTRAVSELERRIGDRLADDRNLADNLRVYLERLGTVTGDLSRLDALMPKLIAAWPDDYVYAFRHGRSLLARGRAEEALPFLEQAAPQAYGLNRILVAEQRVRALQILGREADARVVVAETLKANGPWFPEQAEQLKALLKPKA